MRDWCRELSLYEVERLAWIMRQKDELKRRYRRLAALLEGQDMGDGETVGIYLYDLELARADLMALLNTMAPPAPEPD